MLRKAETKKLQIAVGYNFRFERGLQFLKKQISKIGANPPLNIFCQFGYHIKFWRYGYDYKNHYILKKGGGIVLDGSHEYDYLRWLLDDEIESVYCQTKKTSTISLETESLANILLKFKKGTIANILIDCIRPNYERSCHVIHEKGDLKWQFNVLKGSWKNYNSKAKSLVTHNQINKSPTNLNFSMKTNDMYESETQNFIFSILKGKKPLVDGWEGLKTLKIGLAALKSARLDRVIRL